MKGTAKLNNLFSRIKFLPKTGNRLKQTFIEGGRVLQPTKATTLYHPALPKSEKHTNYIMFSLFFLQFSFYYRLSFKRLINTKISRNYRQTKTLQTITSRV